MYNSFVDVAKSNNINIKEYIEVRPPYRWFVEVAESHLPVFLKYEIATKEMQKFLLEKLVPIYPNEEYNLKRKKSTPPQSFEDFVSPTIFKRIPSEPYALCFRYKNKEQLMRYSKELGIKIWLLGRHREWFLAFTFNKFIRNYIYTSDVILEKNNIKEFSKPCEFEVDLNFKKLIKVKLNNKVIDYPYIEDGVYHPLKKLPKEIKSTYVF
jgi:hypothetical protein